MSHLYTSSRLFFLFNPPAPPEIYTLSLHDALPISTRSPESPLQSCRRCWSPRSAWSTPGSEHNAPCRGEAGPPRSEEHTSELQSRFELVCRLLLEKKNRKVKDVYNHTVRDGR